MKLNVLVAVVLVAAVTGCRAVAHQAAEASQRAISQAETKSGPDQTRETIVNQNPDKQLTEQAPVNPSNAAPHDQPSIHRTWQNIDTSVSKDGVRESYLVQRDYTAEGTEKICIEVVYSKVKTLRFFVRGVNGYRLDGDKLTSYGGEATYKSVTINGENVSNPSADERTKGMYLAMLSMLKETGKYRVEKVDTDTLTLITSDGDKVIYTAVPALMEK